MKISVITVVFNRVDTISAAIRSVQAQTHQNIEHVIQDGGSSDGTLEEIGRYADDRTLIVSEPDGGIYDAINRAIQRSTGDVVGLMHSDDFFANEGVLAKVSEHLSSCRADGLYGDLEYVDGSNLDSVVRYWRSGSYDPASLKWGWMPPHPTLYLRREVFARFGVYDTSFSIAADYEAMLRYLIRGGISLGYIPEVLVRMRLGGASNGSIRHIVRKSREDFRALKRHNVGGIATLAAKNLRKTPQFLTRKPSSK